MLQYLQAVVGSDILYLLPIYFQWDILIFDSCAIHSHESAVRKQTEREVDHLNLLTYCYDTCSSFLYRRINLCISREVPAANTFRRRALLRIPANCYYVPANLSKMAHLAIHLFI